MASREKDELSSPELSSWEGNSELQDIIIQKVLARCQTLLDKEPVLFTNSDKVDNVPGVKKCGPKTAVKWLASGSQSAFGQYE